MKEDPEQKFVRVYGKLMKCIEMKGGKCQECGKDLRNKPWLADFHHRPGETKYTTISQMYGQRFSSIKKELGKCDLFCNECHRLHHFDHERFDRLRNDILEYRDGIDPDAKEIDQDAVFRLVKQGISSDKIGRMLGVNGRSIRTVIRKLEKDRGEKLMLTKREYINKHQKITDDELIECKKQGMSMDDICSKFNMSHSGLYTRVHRLRNTGQLQ